MAVKRVRLAREVHVGSPQYRRGDADTSDLRFESPDRHAQESRAPSAAVAGRSESPVQAAPIAGVR